MTEALGSVNRPLAFLCHPYHRGGVTRWMLDAASAWAARGNPSWLVVPTPRQPFVSARGRPAIADLYGRMHAATRPQMVTHSVGNAFEFGTEAYRARVYANLLRTGVPAGVPVVVSDDPACWRGVALLGRRNPLIGVLHADEQIYYDLLDSFHASASAVVCVSQRVAKNARRTPYDVRLEVIACGIVLPSLQSRLRERGELTRLLWVGRINETQKRVSDLPKIASALHQAGHRFHLDIIGDGEDSGALRNAVNRAELNDSVSFRGWLPATDVGDSMASADLMILPSNFEGMPVAAMEALAYGCSVVGSDTCGLEEYRDASNAKGALWVYPRGDVGAAVCAIEHALLVPLTERQTIARAFAETHFDIGLCMDRYARLLSSLPSGATVESDSVGNTMGDAASWVLSRARLARTLLQR